MINSIFFDELYKQFAWLDSVFTPVVKNCSSEFFFDGFEYKLMSVSTNMNVLSQNETFFVTKVKINAKNDVYIKGDRDRITQVVNNIITNAIKYSYEKAEIKAFIDEDANYYKLTIKDTGMGIQKEDISRIFERFYRVDKARSRAMGGTGLGLAIAKEIMEIHKGKITVESEYGKGTAMTIWFNKKFDENSIEKDI